MMRGKKAREAALVAIAEEIKKCRTCKKDKVGLAVPGEGNPEAEILFLGEAPGKKESEAGRPFIGPSGKILRALIKEAGLSEDEVFITSPVKYLPKHVTPTRKEVLHGRRHLLKQLEVIRPKFIVLLGRTACLAMLDEDVSISKRHGEVFEKNGQRFMIAYHPAAPLHSPKLRAELFSDFKKLKKLVRAWKKV